MNLCFGAAVLAWGLTTFALCAVMLVELVWEVRIERFRNRSRK